MSNPEPKTVRYGLYYKAIFQLVESAPGKIILMYLADEYRQQMKTSLLEQTIFVSQKRISEILGLNRRTVTASLLKLEGLGLIKMRPNAIIFNGDEFVSLVKYFEALEYSEQKTFTQRFKNEGVLALEGNIEQGCRKELIGLQGTSLLLTPMLKYTSMCKNAQPENSDDESCAEIHSSVHKCTTMCKSTHIGVKMHRFLKQFAEVVQKYTDKSTFDRIFSTTPCAEVHNDEYEVIKEAFYTGDFPENIKIDQNLLCTFTQLAVHFYTPEDSKAVQKCTTVINIDNKNNKPASLLEKGEEDFPLKPLSNEEGWEPSSDSEEFEDFLGIVELSGEEPFGRHSAPTSQIKHIVTHPYRDYPFFSESEAKRITASLNPDLTYNSPVELFINLFWWGCWDLFTENYDSRDYDENGDPIDSDDINDLKMIDAVLPVEDVLRLAEQVWNDIAGAVEKGVYEDAYGTYKLGFTSIDNLQPYFIFDWIDAEVDGKLGLKVSLKRFRNIEATVIEKIPVSKTRSEIAAETRLDRAFTKAIMEAGDDTQLTPIEKVVRMFYQSFVKFDSEYRPEYFTNSEHQQVEGRNLPGYIYKGSVVLWCHDQEMSAEELFETLSQSNRQIHGSDIKMLKNLFSARKVHRWNVAHGYNTSIASDVIETFR